MCPNWQVAEDEEDSQFNSKWLEWLRLRMDNTSHRVDSMPSTLGGAPPGLTGAGMLSKSVLESKAICALNGHDGNRTE